MTNKCKYYVKDIFKFNGDDYCTCFNEICSALAACPYYCQIFEDQIHLDRYINKNKELEQELAKHNQMLMDAHFQNKKLTDELILTQKQYSKVVEQNKELQKLINSPK